MIDKGNSAVPEREEVTGRERYVALLIFVLLALFYVYLIGRWPLDQDEFYTLEHSTKPVSTILKRPFPLYFLLAHFSLKLPLSEAVGLRLPSALAASLAASSIYLACTRLFGARAAAYTTILLISSPWLLRFSQVARYYSVGFLFAAVSQIWLIRFVLGQRRRDLAVFLGAGFLSVWTQSVALIAFAANVVAAIAVAFVADPAGALRLARRRWIWLVLPIFVAFAMIVFLWEVLDSWLSASAGEFGQYTLVSLVLALGANTGFHVWLLAFIPMLKPLGSWSRAESVLAFTVALCVATFVSLVEFGGGIAPRYLAYGLPSLFILAGLQLEHILARVPTRRLRTAALAVCIAVGIPSVTSTLVDGNHYDYPSAIEFVESMEGNPLVACTSHRACEYYARGDYEVYELGFLNSLRVNDGEVGRNFVGRRIVDMIELSEDLDRPLVLVSRESRNPMSREAADWLLSRFAIVHVVEKPRYDHRRLRIVVYEYRP